MKIHKGDVITITRQMSFNWTPYLEIRLNGYLQHDNDFEYMLKRCGVTMQDMIDSLHTKESQDFIIN